MQAIKPFIENKNVIIWDWNGTLLNDLELCLETLCEILGENNLPAISSEEHRQHFRFPVRDYYTILGFDYEKTPYETLADRYIELHNPKVPSAKLFEGVHKFLKETKDAGIRHFALSVAQQDDLETQTQNAGIYHYFEALCGVNNILGASKLERGKQLMREHELNPSEVLLIGDTDHDLEVGNALGVDTLLIADGHQSFERLSQMHHAVLETRT
jgi:phosphoglycolate phosphatase